jgi:hypothetical protein
MLNKSSVGKLTLALIATLATQSGWAQGQAPSGTGAKAPAQSPQAFIQKDIDPAAAFLGIPWSASREEISAEMKRAGLEKTEDSRFDLSFNGTARIGGEPIPKVFITYMYTPEGQLKEIFILSDVTTHPRWRKVAFANFGTAVGKSKADGWPGSKLFNHMYIWPLKRFSVLLQYSTLQPDATAAAQYDSDLSIKIVDQGMSAADLGSPQMRQFAPRNE